ncbi:hypothetical protein MKY09_14380 [Psychrobacillus sp. FSL K6-4046]|uniref:hypothetical protein n=1 Tax=Psychrobacillus sp. FSL K6-4046 TaxID=2921550 RepID=UPI00315B0833
MIYVNGNLITVEKNPKKAEVLLRDYLIKKKLVLVNNNDEPVSFQDLSEILLGNSKEIKLKGISSSIILREFKEELHNYILRVEQYIEVSRQNENYSSMLDNFVQVVEAIIEFSKIGNFLQKELVSHQQINNISTMAFEQAKVGNKEYILDLLEYELLPVLNFVFDETNEVM